MTPQLSLNSWRHIAAIILLAALVRVHAASRLECVSRDGVHFVEFAKQLATDPVTAMKGTSKQPGYSYLLLGAVRLLGGDASATDPQLWLRAGQLISVIGGVAACVFIYFVTRRLFDPMLAGIAGLFAALWPQGAELSADLLSDMPHLALYLAAILAGLNAIEREDGAKQQIAWAALCGALAGAAYWLRQEALGCALAVAVCLICPRPGRRLSRDVAAAGLVMLTCIASISPQIYITGNLMPNKNIWDLLFGAPDATAAAPIIGSPIQLIATNGSMLLAEWMPWYKAPGRMADAWGASGKYILSTLVLAGLFLRSAPRAGGAGARLIAVAIVLQLIAVQLRVKSYGEISSRYLVIPAALTIPWAAAGFASLISLLAIRAGRERPQLTVAVSLLVVLAPLAWFCARPISPDKACFRQAGQWLARNASRNSVIMAHDRLEQLMFYAGCFESDPRWAATASAGAPDAPLKPSDLIGELRSAIVTRRPRWYIDATQSRRWSDADDAAFFLELRGGAMPLREAQRFTSGKHEVFVFEVEPVK